MNNFNLVVALITSDNDYQAEQAAAATEAAARLGVSALRTKGMRSAKPVGLQLKMIKGDWTERSGHHAIKSWLSLSTSRKLDIRLVGCQNDAMAMGARKAFGELAGSQEREYWLKVPFTGCDGVTKTGQEWVADS